MFSPELVAVAVYTAICVGIGGGLLFAIWALTRLLGLRRGKRGKYDTYECGVPLLDESRARIPVKFYVVALLFVLFDIETVFLLPYAVSYKQLGMQGLVAILIFVGILGGGLAYLILRDALTWE